MCGIVGYVGHRQAQQVLFNCLHKLEYRGYDSCGIAIGNGSIGRFKDAVRVDALRDNSPTLEGTIGIGHTRWATHGVPTAINAHPHFDCSQKIGVVHNGIISNYETLRRKLMSDGHNFVSDTDTEVIPHLIEKYFHGDLFEAIRFALKEIEGSYAIVVLTDNSDRLIVSRKESPLCIGIGDGEKIIASDVPAMLDYINKVVYLEDGDIAMVSKDELYVTQNGKSVNREVQAVKWNRTEVEKTGYEHFLLKEIHEQPRVIRESLAGWLDYADSENGNGLDTSIKSLMMVGCGTSYHACLIGKQLFEELLGLPVRTELGSEFLLCNRIIPPSAVVGITQSGETADVLLSLKRLKELLVKIIVVTNVPGSTASRVADQVVYTSAGPELSVAATKSFMAQLIELYKMAISSKLVNWSLREQLLKEFRYLHVLVQQVLENEPEIARYAKFISEYSTVFYVGRGMNYPTALEGALKLKEVSYIHAEGYAAGELKHGPFALLDKKTPVIALATPEEVHSSMISSVKEIKARGSPVIALVDEKDESMTSFADMVIKVPHTSSIFAPIVNVVALQLIAYYAAKYRNCPIDFPRHLAKSVTVT